MALFLFNVGAYSNIQASVARSQLDQFFGLEPQEQLQPHHSRVSQRRG